MQENNNSTIANEIFTKIKELPIGAEFVFGKFFNDYELDMDSKFKVQEEVLNLCEKNNVNITNTNPDAVMGMPWVFTFKKNN